MIVILVILLCISLCCTYYFREKNLAENFDKEMTFKIRKGKRHD